jgi:ABC-2 type transport system ATP-binding protein
MIALDHVSKSFSGKPALTDVSLGVAAGERVAFIGHNGSGKSTLLRCILGLHSFSGHIACFGLDVRHERQTLLCDVAFVPQRAPALRNTVAEYLRLVEAICGCPRDRVLAVAAPLGLDLAEVARTPFRKLSGGMQHKLLIAAALARAPRLLLLDEPTANLDPASRQVFYAMLAGLPRESVVLHSSHRIDELAGLVGRVVEMDGGRIVADDMIAPASATDGARGAFACEVVVRSDAPAIAAGLAAWGLERVAAPGKPGWVGTIAASDRFRFLSMLARWSTSVESVSLSPTEETGR